MYAYPVIVQFRVTLSPVFLAYRKIISMPHSHTVRPRQLIGNSVSQQRELYLVHQQQQYYNNGAAAAAKRYNYSNGNGASQQQQQYDEDLRVATITALMQGEGNLRTYITLYSLFDFIVLFLSGYQLNACPYSYFCPLFGLCSSGG